MSIQKNNNVQNNDGTNLIAPMPGAVKKRKRLGRGNSSGHGGESGRGHKGQKSRTGYSKRFGFEGGQTPFFRRLPKKRGLGNPVTGMTYGVINLSVINDNFNENDVISRETLLDKGLVAKRYRLVKILGNGDVTKSFQIKVNAVSKTANEKLLAANSKIELL
jgi:large subunit ribosomal protein L15